VLIVFVAENGLKMYDLIQGRGSTAEDGQKATVHYDCLWSGLDVVSSRSARLLGENRTLSEPFEFVVGQPLDSKAKMSDFSGGGLFSGMGGPKPPPALSTSVRGMKVGGKVRYCMDYLFSLDMLSTNLPGCSTTSLTYMIDHCHG
jgi:peptidylprolyl isomerase